MGHGRSIKAGLNDLSVEGSLVELNCLHEDIRKARDKYKNTGDSQEYMISLFSKQGLLSKLINYKKFSNSELKAAIKSIRNKYEAINLKKATEEFVEANKKISEEGCDFLKHFNQTIKDSVDIILEEEKSIEKFDKVKKNLKKVDEAHDKFLNFVKSEVIDKVEEAIGNSATSLILDVVNFSESYIGKAVDKVLSFIPGLNFIILAKDLILGKFEILNKLGRIAGSIANQKRKNQHKQIEDQIKNLKDLTLEMHNKQLDFIEPKLENFMKESEKIWKILIEIEPYIKKIYKSLDKEREKIEELHSEWNKVRDEQLTKESLYELQKSVFKNIIFLCKEAEDKIKK